MQAVWITRSAGADIARSGVIVFAAGWAGSDELVRHLALPEGCDLLCLFDYRTLPSPEETAGLYSQITPYLHKHLIAWSFGVWAATEIFGACLFDRPGFWDTATAVNGTPIPISDAYGIPERAFAVTVRSIGGAGTAKFLERMCGTPEILREFYKHRSTRSLEEIYDELIQLRRQALDRLPDKPEPARSFWTAAVVGGKDAIFPPGNMSAYWREAGVPIIFVEDMPHYPLFRTDILTSLTTDEAR